MKLDNISFNEQELLSIKLIQDLLKAELSLYEFLRQAWPIIEGRIEFIDGWHLQAICEHLEAVANRQIKNLLINMPPRCCKSTLVSIAFPAWVWIRNPHERFLYASYARSLSIKHSLDCRRLISSPWYQARWGNRYQLMKDQNAKTRFDNNAKGYRVATSVGAAATGEGGNFLITDDPNNVRDGDSDVKRENTLDWWSKVWSTRLNDKKNDCRIIVQQRIHESDVSGFVMNNDLAGEWTKLILPMEFEERRKSVTVILPSTTEKKWCDPRLEEGELLWPAGIDAKALNSLKNDLGSEYARSGQLQQSPSPAEGGIIKKKWFQWWKSPELPTIDFILQSWDTALTAKDTSAYSACTTWGVFTDHNYIENVMLLSLWQGKVEYPELREMVKRLYFDYRDNGKYHNPAFRGTRVDLCLVEAKASGDPLIQDLRMSGINITPYPVNRMSGDNGKTKRVRLVTPLIEGGHVWMPAQAPKYERLLPFADLFVESAACFPNADSKDLVDTMSQALQKLKDLRIILHPKDTRAYPPNTPDQELRVY